MFYSILDNKSCIALFYLQYKSKYYKLKLNYEK